MQSSPESTSREAIAIAGIWSSFPALGELTLVLAFSLVGGIIYIIETQAGAGVWKSVSALIRSCGYGVAFSLVIATLVGTIFPSLPRAELLTALSFGIAAGPDQLKKMIVEPFIESILKRLNK